MTASTLCRYTVRLTNPRTSSRSVAVSMAFLIGLSLFVCADARSLAEFRKLLKRWPLNGDRRGFDRVSGNTVDALGPEQHTRGRHGAIDVDTPAGILDHNRFEALATCVFRGIAHAEIEREAGEKDSSEAAFAQVSGEPGMRLAIVFVERRIRIDLALIALAEHQLRVRNRQVFAQRGAACALHTMIRPKHLGAVGDLDRLIRRLAGMRGGEGEVAARMPVLRQHHMRELACQAIDQWHHLVATRHRQAAAGAEVVLDIDDQQDIPIADRDFVGHRTALSRCARRSSTSAASRTSTSAISTGQVAPGARSRKVSGRRSRSCAARARMSARVGVGPTRWPSFMTSSIRGSPAWGSDSSDKTSPAIRPSDP